MHILFVQIPTTLSSYLNSMFMKCTHFSYSKATSCPRPHLFDIYLSVTPMKNSYAYNEVITFSCTEGYQLKGSTSAKCGNTGNFRERQPNCECWIFSCLNCIIL